MGSGSGVVVRKGWMQLWRVKDWSDRCGEAVDGVGELVRDVAVLGAEVSCWQAGGAGVGAGWEFVCPSAGAGVGGAALLAVVAGFGAVAEAGAA